MWKEVVRVLVDFTAEIDARNWDPPLISSSSNGLVLVLAACSRILAGVIRCLGHCAVSVKY